jgi:membrane-associated phospholipid phosphatase
MGRMSGRPVDRLRSLAGSPLLPPAARRAALGVLGACVAVVAVLAVWFAHQTRPSSLDAAVDGRLQAALGSHPAVLGHLVDAGDPIPVLVATVVVVACCLVVRRWKGALLAAVSVPVASALTEFVLKPLVDRTLAGGLSYPSGHTTGVTALACTIAILLVSPPRSRLPGLARGVLAIAALAAAAAVAVALVALRLHYFTDTVGGAALSAAVVLAVALSLDALSLRRPSPRAPGGGPLSRDPLSSDRRAADGPATPGSTSEKIPTVSTRGSSPS